MQVRDFLLKQGITPSAELASRTVRQTYVRVPRRHLMRRRYLELARASLHDRIDLAKFVKADDRKFFWPLGRRPDDHPGLSDLGL